MAALKATTVASPGEFAKTFADTEEGKAAAAKAAAEADAAATSWAEARSHPPEFSTSSEDSAARDAAEREAALKAKVKAEAEEAARTHPPEFRPRTIAQRLAAEEPEYDPDESLTGGTPRSDTSSPSAAAGEDDE